MEDPTKNASANAGSAGANADGSGASGQTNAGDTIPKAQYDELYSKFGEIGEKLGVYKKFYEESEPLMDLLEQNPEIEEALLSGKFDAELAKAVLDGRVTKETAATVADAHQQAKDNMTKEELAKVSPEEMLKKMDAIIEAKFDALLKPTTSQIEKKIEGLGAQMTAQQRIAANEQKIREFIANTPDFGDFSGDIQKRMEERPGTTVMEAYELAKARHIVQSAQKSQEGKNARDSKEIAANAGGGRGSRSGAAVVTGDAREQFIKMTGDRVGF